MTSQPVAPDPLPDVQIGARVPGDLAAWLDAYAQATERSISGVIRIALAEYRRRVEEAA